MATLLAVVVECVGELELLEAVVAATEVGRDSMGDVEIGFTIGDEGGCGEPFVCGSSDVELGPAIPCE